MPLFSELKRRNVLRMAALYLVAAWLVIQVADVLIDLAGLPQWLGPAILAVLAVGFPIALVVSWFYELTPEGLALETDIAPGDSIAHSTNRRMDFVIIAILSAAVILFAWDKWWPEGPMEQSIAVLPFENLSGDSEQEYFSDGISEEILNLLAQIEPLKVIARTSSFSFKDKDVDIATVAQRLNVSHVLEGSVRRSGDRLRITAQLIDATDSTHIWSQNYDRELGDIFAIQDEIAAAIVGALREHVGLEVDIVPIAVAAANTEAHDALLRGRHLLAQRTWPTIEGAIREFEKSIELDPDYAVAHAELAIATLLLAGYGDLTMKEAVARASPYAEQAMSLNPELAESHAAMGYLVWTQSWSGSRPEEARSYFKRAIQINPNYSIVYTWLANLLENQFGSYAEVFPMRKAALRLDPLSIPAITSYISVLIETNRLAEADRELDKLASISPQHYAFQRRKRVSLGGKWAARLMATLETMRIDPTSDAFTPWRDLAFIGLYDEAHAIKYAEVPLVFAMSGRPVEALEQFELLLAEDPLYYHGPLGLLSAAAGDYARARPILEEQWLRANARITRGPPCTVYCAAALIAIRRAAGDEAGATELVNAIRDNVRRYRDAGIVLSTDPFTSPDFEEGVADYYAGEREQGLTIIAKAAENGVFIIPKGGLEVLDEDPGFLKILEMQKARQAEEREKFLAIVCNDNPYADVWQPMPETCAGIAKHSS